MALRSGSLDPQRRARCTQVLHELMRSLLLVFRRCQGKKKPTLDYRIPPSFSSGLIHLLVIEDTGFFVR